MNNLTPFGRKLAAIGDRFAMWRIIGTNAEAIEIEATKLSEAVSAALMHVRHKQVFIIRQTLGVSGRSTLHHYTVKQSTKRYTFRESYDGGPQVRVPMLEAVLLYSVEVKAFEPTAPWKWSRGADVVGADRTVVEQRS